MSSTVVVEGTLAFLFPRDAAQPTVADMARFIKTLKGYPSSMETAYKISEEKSVFIRFKSQEAMNYVFVNNDKSLPFLYTDGKEATVRMSVAGNTRYVRIFDLPPEISDANLVSVMAKYGTIRRTVRERFPAEYQLNMFTGVRGIYIDLEQEIPEILYFCNRKGRLYYDGLVQKCFKCNSDTHLKKSCPLLHEQQQGNAQRSATIPLKVDKIGEKVEESSSDADSVNGSESNKKASNKKQSKTKKAEAKRQRSDPDSDSVSNQIHKKPNKANSSLSDSDNSLTTMSNAIPNKGRCRIATYEWIDDENERRLLIEEDKKRIAEATGTPLNQMTFYHD